MVLIGSAVVAPFVIAGYAGLTALLLLPLLCVRWMFPRQSNGGRRPELFAVPSAHGKPPERSRRTTNDEALRR